jgi:DNA polymerase-3 subunit chi
MTSSCQVDFYVLSSPGLDARLMACRLALMSWERGLPTTVVTENENSARELDQLLWESPAGRFLPHEKQQGAKPCAAPVKIALIDDMSEVDSIQGSVAINLCQQPLDSPERFSRVLEIVPQSEGARSSSRLKFKFYRDQGITPGSHEISK